MARKDNSSPAPIPEPEWLEVTGAREHNLADIDVRIPRNSLTVITGLSGSGKSSLAFDTIYAEGQRRYMETFSSYARQFIGTMERPDVEHIAGLSPVIAIEQKTTSRNPRSTVGTVTEVYDFFRLLFARIGEAHSWSTGRKMVRYSEDQINDRIQEEYTGRKIMILAPLVRGRKGHYRELFEQTRKQGFTKVRVDGVTLDLTPGLQVDRYKTHDIEVVVDRIIPGPDRLDRLRQSVRHALRLGNGLLFLEHSGELLPFSKDLMDPDTGISYEEPSPNTFSFNSPYGACPKCSGLGQVHEVDLDKVIPDRTKSINDVGIVPLGEVRENSTFTQLRSLARRYRFGFSTPIDEIPKEALDIILYGGSATTGFQPGKNDFSYDLAQEGLVNMLQRWYTDTSSENIRRWAEDFLALNECPECGGSRLRIEARHFLIDGKNIADLARMDIASLEQWSVGLEKRLSARQVQIGQEVIKEIRLRLGFLRKVGLDYLNLDRPARTLSGGESQRIRLATQIGSKLTGITYILDEPSIGLHQRDNQRLIEALQELTRIGNTVIVVEHDKDIMLASDYVLDLGPGAGRFGGRVVGKGKPNLFLKEPTTTAAYLSGRKHIPVPGVRRPGSGHFLEIQGATGNNLRDVSVKIPLGTLTLVTGVSGSGKSTLINETLYPILRKHFYRSIQEPLPYRKIKGLEHLDKVIEIDQTPIGRTPRSNPATYTNVFNDIRKLFAEVPEAKIRGYKPGRFSFNVKGGRCEVCEGAGRRVIEMNFLPDVHVECEQCLGRRYNRETLEVLYKGRSISDVLDMQVSEAVGFFENIPAIFRKLRTLEEVGLGYITLGQQATTLSGGEAQRVKLAEELSKRDTGQTFYILDEPTTGLHFEDILHLMHVLNQLVEKGNTVLVIEHNLDVIKCADWIVDLGPEGGSGGGEVLFQGTPEELLRVKRSYTGQFLQPELAAK
jgi:excinuclease ABC subunit A